MKKKNERIAIDLPNGLKLVAEQNQDPNLRNEIFVGIENGDGVWLQNLAVIRNAYSVNNDLDIVWNPNLMEVLVYADKDDEDYTDKYAIDIRKDT